jgi:hypothetical protein
MSGEAVWLISAGIGSGIASRVVLTMWFSLWWPFIRMVAGAASVK